MDTERPSEAILEERRVVQLVALSQDLAITVSSTRGVVDGLQRVLALALLSDGTVRYVISTGGGTPMVIE